MDASNRTNQQSVNYSAFRVRHKPQIIVKLSFSLTFQCLVQVDFK